MARLPVSAPASPSLSFLLNKLNFHTADFLCWRIFYLYQFTWFGQYLCATELPLTTTTRSSSQPPMRPYSFLFTVYSTVVQLQKLSPLYQLKTDNRNINSSLSLADFLPTSCSAALPSVPTWALGNPAHFSPPYFFSPTSRSLPTTHLLQCKHTVVSLLDSSSSTSTAQCSSNDTALKCRLEICYFSSDLMISTLAFTLCYHKRNIFPRIS